MVHLVRSLGMISMPIIACLSYHFLYHFKDDNRLVYT